MVLMNLFAMETQTQRTDLWAQWGKERVGRMKRGGRKTYITVCKTDSLWEPAV